MAKVMLPGYRCERCGHEWLPRKLADGSPGPEPRTCPKCKSAYWNLPRKVPKRAGTHAGGRKDG